MQEASPRQNDILEKIAHYNKLVMNLKREYNALSPVSKLSTELLSEIFLCYRSQIAADFHGAARESADFDWLGVLHVCHHWRNAVVEDPRFWTHVVARVDMNEDLLTAILQRSKSMPISIVYHLCDRGQDDMTFDIIAECAPRIRSLRVVQFCPLLYSVKYIFESLSQGSDVLETIEFYAILKTDDFLYACDSRRDLEEEESQGIGEVLSSIPDDTLIFAGRTPNLRRIKVSGYDLPPCNRLFCASICHLELEQCCARYPYGDDLLQSLESMPLLESITLRSTLASHLGGRAYPESPSRLPSRLRRLVVYDDLRIIVAFLRHVSIPDDTSIHFGDMNTMRSADYNALRGALSPLVALSPKTVVCWGERTWNHCYIWRCWWPFTAAPAGMEPFLDIATGSSLDSVRLSLELRGKFHLYDVIPEHDVRTVVARGDHIPRICHPEAAPMRSLGEIHIYRGKNKHIFWDIFGGGVDGAQDPVLPSLRVVRFFDVTWGTQPAAEQYDDFEPFATVDFALVVEGLRRRRERGFAPLDELSVARCNGRLEACQLEPMREFVGQVVCDDTVVSCDHAESVPAAVVDVRSGGRIWHRSPL